MTSLHPATQHDWRTPPLQHSKTARRGTSRLKSGKHSSRPTPKIRWYRRAATIWASANSKTISGLLHRKHFATSLQTAILGSPTTQSPAILQRSRSLAGNWAEGNFNSRRQSPARRPMRPPPRALAITWKRAPGIRRQPMQSSSWASRCGSQARAIELSRCGKNSFASMPILLACPKCCTRWASHRLRKATDRRLPPHSNVLLILFRRTN